MPFHSLINFFRDVFMYVLGYWPGAQGERRLLVFLKSGVDCTAVCSMRRADLLYARMSIGHHDDWPRASNPSPLFHFTRDLAI